MTVNRNTRACWLVCLCVCVCKVSRSPAKTDLQNDLCEDEDDGLLIFFLKTSVYFIGLSLHVCLVW